MNACLSVQTMPGVTFSVKQNEWNPTGFPAIRWLHAMPYSPSGLTHQHINKQLAHVTTTYSSTRALSTCLPTIRTLMRCGTPTHPFIHNVGLAFYTQHTTHDRTTAIRLVEMLTLHAGAAGVYLVSQMLTFVATAFGHETKKKRRGETIEWFQWAPFRCQLHRFSN